MREEDMKGKFVEHRNGASLSTQGAKSTSTGSFQPVLAEYVWLDGELIPSENATVQFLNPSLNNGSGVFEGIRCYNTPRGPAVFRLAEHLELFMNRIRLLGVEDFRYDVDDLRDIVCRVVQVNRFSECYIRPALYFEGVLGLDLAAYRPVLGVAAWRSDRQLSREALENGIRLMVSAITRNHHEADRTRANIMDMWQRPLGRSCCWFETIQFTQRRWRGF